jgi:hypothetical protein
MKIISSNNECIRRSDETRRRQSCLWIRSLGSSEEKDVWLRSMKFIVNPSS